MIRLFELPHSRAAELLATGAPVYLPINPVEYHGPHLPLDTDAIASLKLCERMSEGLERRRGWAPLLASPIAFGSEPAPGPGSRFTSYREMRQLILASCRALARAGAKRVVLMTFHGGPLHNLAIDAGVRWLRRQGIPALAPFQLVLRKFLDFEPRRYQQAYDTIPEAEDRALALAWARQDIHGGFWETSVLLHLAPESVSTELARISDCPKLPERPLIRELRRWATALGFARLERELFFLETGSAWLGLKPFPGYTGCPRLARAEAGRHFAETIVSTYVEQGEAVLCGGVEPPLPLFSWFPALSLGGIALRWLKA